MVRSAYRTRRSWTRRLQTGWHPPIRCQWRNCYHTHATDNPSQPPTTPPVAEATLPEATLPEATLPEATLPGAPAVEF
jgi:hypothetical protein